MKTNLICDQCLEKDFTFKKVEELTVATCTMCGNEIVMETKLVPKKKRTFRQNLAELNKPTVEVPWKQPTAEQIKKYGIHSKPLAEKGGAEANLRV